MSTQKVRRENMHIVLRTNLALDFSDQVWSGNDLR